MPGTLAILRSGIDAMSFHPARTLAAVACALAALLPYLVGVAIAEGVRRDGSAGLDRAGDLFVSGARFGAPAPLPERVTGVIRGLAGVEEVVPRIVGTVRLGAAAEEAVVVGLPATYLRETEPWIQGRAPAPGSAPELVVGADLASALRLGVGSYLPPFYHNPRGERTFRVVGVLRDAAPLWSARLLLMALPSAAEVFDQPEQVTDLVVRCQPQTPENVRSAIRAYAARTGLQVRITSRSEVRALLSGLTLHREGILHLHLVLLVLAATGVVGVTSMGGATERRREVALLKALGWSTDQVLLRCLAESLLITILALSAGVTLALLWLGPLKGIGLAPLFIPGLSPSSPVRIPYHLSHSHLFLAAVISGAVILTGSLYPAWRAAMAEPFSLLR